MKIHKAPLKAGIAVAIGAILFAAGALSAAEILSPFEAAAQATGKSTHVAPTNQFVLIDTLLRYVPAARMEGPVQILIPIFVREDCVVPDG